MTLVTAKNIIRCYHKRTYVCACRGEGVILGTKKLHRLVRDYAGREDISKIVLTKGS